MFSQQCDKGHSNDSWKAYYRQEIENVQKMPGGKYNPFCLDFEKTISERYEQIKKYRILLYGGNERQIVTKFIFQFENICKNYGFPLFFVLDFEAYQAGKNWKYDGKPIKNVNGAFFKYAVKKRERMIDSGAWQGEDMENYVYCGANENYADE